MLGEDPVANLVLELIREMPQGALDLSKVRYNDIMLERAAYSVTVSNMCMKPSSVIYSTSPEPRNEFRDVVSK